MVEREPCLYFMFRPATAAVTMWITQLNRATCMGPSWSRYEPDYAIRREKEDDANGCDNSGNYVTESAVGREGVIESRDI